MCQDSRRAALLRTRTCPAVERYLLRRTGNSFLSGFTLEHTLALRLRINCAGDVGDVRTINSVPYKQIACSEKGAGIADRSASHRSFLCIAPGPKDAAWPHQRQLLVPLHTPGMTDYYPVGHHTLLIIPNNIHSLFGAFRTLTTPAHDASPPSNSPKQRFLSLPITSHPSVLQKN